MMHSKPTWKFPEESQGVEGMGFDHPALTIFSGDRNTTLFRECLQNSLDAGVKGNEVTVEIKLEQLSAELFDPESLIEALNSSCKSDWNNDSGRSQFKEAIKLFKQRTIPTLSITDVNTIGAADEKTQGRKISPWQTMVKSSGFSQKFDGSLGSYGLGKHACFNVGPSRTVLYSTCYLNQSGGYSRRFLGRTILITHFKKNEQQHSYNGYLGNDCQALADDEIPQQFMMDTPGTKILIPGYRVHDIESEENWELRALNVAAENFFFAIIHGKLGLIIGENLVLTKDSIIEGGECWELIKSERTRNYIRIASETPKATTYIEGIGDIELRISVVNDDSISDRRALALVRSPGLKIADDPKSLGPVNRSMPKDWNPFVAIIACTPRKDEIDWMLKECEAPCHDSIALDHIRTAMNIQKHKDAAKIFKEFRSWIYDNIKEYAAPNRITVMPDTPVLKRLGLFIEDDIQGERLKLSDLRPVDRAPRESIYSNNNQNSDEPTEIDSEDGEENFIPLDEESNGGTRPGTDVSEGKTKVIMKKRYETEAIFVPIYDENGKKLTHKLRAHFTLPARLKDEELIFEFLSIGEDEKGYRPTIRFIECKDVSLRSKQNIFYVPKSLCEENKRLSVDISLNEAIGTSTFNLRHIIQTKGEGRL